ncbi:aldehyde dehydrogenase domain-containing protein [Gongronella butleri]|nr:aldehyde dehydrogenase domain-containing protein [Gongronella butleri]
MTHSDLIVKVKAPNGTDLKVQTGLFINNEFVKGDSTIDTVNPATGEVICTVQAAEANKVDEAVKFAEKAYDEVWSKTSAIDRQKLMFKLADLIERDIEEIATLESMDNGKPYQFAATFDIPALVGMIRYYAGYTDKIHGKVLDTPAAFNFVELQPYGVTAGILPWNFPAVLLGGKIAPSLAAGNVMIVKVSEITPLSALKVAALVVEAGFPPGVVQIINGYGKTAGAALARHMRIGKISFTGSTLVGREILKAAAETNLKKVSLELGGKSPNIVFEDADLDQAVKWAHRGIFFNSGQVCTAGSRIFVAEAIYDKFVAALTLAAKEGVTGDPFDAKTAHGPLVSQTQYDRVMGYLESGKADGAKIHLGGKRVGDKGYFIEPTIFTDVKGTENIVREEIFGPVAVVMKFKDEEDVVKRANDTVYGLAAAVHTRDIQRAIRVAKRLQAGTVWINEYNVVEVQTPFGGYRQSGIGRENGEDGLKEWLQVKTVKVNMNIQL